MSKLNKIGIFFILIFEINLVAKNKLKKNNN